MIRTISPTTGSIIIERAVHTPDQITLALQTAQHAFHSHKPAALSSRIAIANKFLDLLDQNKQALVRHVHGTQGGDS